MAKVRLGTRGELLDAALPLPQLLEKLQSMRVAERLCDLGESGEYGLFWTST